MDIFSPRPRHPLAQRLVLRLGVVGIIVSLVITTVAVAVDYRLVVDRALERFDQVEQSYLASIVENTWLQDGERLGVLVLGIRNLPYMERVMVYDQDGNLLAGAGAGGAGTGDVISRSFTLSRTYLGRPQVIGRLDISASLAKIRRPVMERAWVILLANLTIVFAVSAILYWQIYPVVSRPLARIARYARMIGRSDLTDPPAIPLEPTAANDEFYDLAQAFNEMRDEIRRSYLAMQDSDSRHRMLFTSSPISLWEEDFSQVKVALEALRAENGDDLSGYLRTHPEALSGFIAKVKVLDVNDATLALHRAADRQALLGDLGRTLTEDSAAAFQRQLLAIWHGEWELTLESRVSTLDGDLRDVIVHWAVPSGHRDRLDRVIVALEDITERKTAERSLSMTVEKMVQANSELERFAYVAAHDLREPVRGIVSFAQLLERHLAGQIDKDAEDYLQFLIAAANRMQQQVQGLLDYSRAGSGGRGYALVDMDQVMASVWESLAGDISISHAVVEIGPLPQVVGDASQLAEVFRNLVGNSLKFARAGVAPVVRVSAEQVKGDWVFSVCDNGIGIDPKYASEIFQVFRRLHGIGTYPGAGIGLATCRRIIERHGGRIWVAPAPEQGAIISFSLPGSTPVA